MSSIDESINKRDLEDVENSAVLQKTAYLTEHDEAKLTKWQAIKKYPFLCYCIAVIVWNLVSVSFELQAGSVVVSISQFRQDFGNLQPDGSYVLTTKWQSAFSGIPIATQVFGAAFGSWISDRFGKKWVIFTSLLISIGFVAIEFASTTVQIFLLGKSLNGFVLGIIYSCGVAYVAEISPLALRGVATTVCNISFSVGPFVCYVINYSVSTMNSRWAYRSIFAAQWGFAAVSLIILLPIPESPWYHLLNNRNEKAELLYKRLVKDMVVVHQEMAIAINTIKEAKEISEGSSYIDCFRGNNLRRTIVSSVPFIITSFSGLFFTASYTAYYFELLGYTNQYSFRLTIGAQTLSIVGCIAALFVVDRFGRRNNLLYGVLSIIICDIIIASAGLDKNNKGALKVSVGFMMLFGFLYNLGLGAVCYPVCTENATAELRTKTVAIALCAQNMFAVGWSFTIPYIFNPDRANLSSKTMYIFAGFTILFWIYLYFYQTETANRSFDEIDEMYAARLPLRKFKSFVTSVDRENEVHDESKRTVEHIEDA